MKSGELTDHLTESFTEELIRDNERSPYWSHRLLLYFFRLKDKFIDILALWLMNLVHYDS